MPLSEATVLNFLAPLGTCCAIAFLSSGSFTKAETASAILSFVGVVLIAQPTFLFRTGYNDSISTAKPGSNLAGVGFAIMGAIGGIVSIMALRVIA